MSRNTGMSFCRNFVYSAGTVCVNKSIESRSSLAAWSLAFTSIAGLHGQFLKPPASGRPAHAQKAKARLGVTPMLLSASLAA